jgi:alanine dehydrogenase
MLLIDNATVEKLLDMRSCIDALDVGYNDLARGNAIFRPRIDVYFPNETPDGYYRWGTMEGAVRTSGVFAIRMKSDQLTWPDGETEEKYCVEPGTYCGLILLFSTRNGEPLAIINDGVLQHMRVGGCAGLGARYLAREDASVVGMLGSGGMARTYLEAFNLVRPLQSVKVYSPNKAHREAYAEEMSEKLGVPIEPVGTPEEAVRGSHIVSTCTDSLHPVVTDMSWIDRGAHLTSVRATEWPMAVLQTADYTAKLGTNTLDILQEGMERIHGSASYVAGQPEERARIPNPKEDVYKGKYESLIDLMAGKSPGRKSPDDITFFINSGTQGLQFAAVAGRVYELAKERKMGQEIPTGWFLQDIRD